jgi:EAL domain-containing protein (putative c-di-GMP-specific phosphodiesterase class I)
MGAQAVRLSNVDIDNALKNKDFEVLFQPVFDLGNGALARVETFVRWRHPKLGMLPPGAFISFFESQGRMSELTRYVLASALKSYMDWRGPWPPGLSVNLALSDLSDDAFTSHFTKLLRDHDFPADLVTLECPMPPVDMPLETAQAHFQRLGETGARLAIEVRGRANELLRSLDPFPFDEIKTGGSAILRFARTVRGPGLSAIADLLDVANNANAAITAVGVEDQASLAALRGLGFTAAQGNHLGKVGALKDFRPHRINEVRELLNLEPLSQENITALFRTEAPAAQAAKPAPGAKRKDAGKTEDAMLDRLNERVAQYGDAPSEQGETEDAAARAEAAEDEKKAKAREKAKALAMAKRAKTRAARKSAAIERAKAKAATRPEEITDIPAGAASVAASHAPRDMQERLSRAFTAEDKSEMSSPQLTPDMAARTPPPAQTPAPAPAAAETGTPVMISPEELAPQQAKAAPMEKPVNKPSTIERAMMQQGGMQQAGMQQAAAQNSAASASSAPVKLAVGAHRAYFQPGIRVGAPALYGEPETPVKPSGLKLPKREAPSAPRPAAPRQEAPQSQPPISETAAETAREAAPHLKAQPAIEKPIFADPPRKPLLGDLHAETSAAAKRVRRRKPFLKRTVVPMSGHFWPKSWRRAWKRRAAARAADRQAAE